jgi:hypothetical protein
MRITSRALIIWAPRIVGLGLAAFLSLFALDAFSDGRGLLSTIIAFVMGLVPALMVLSAVIAGWSHERFAAVFFMALAVFYAVLAREHFSWVVLISSPLALVAVLFFLSWRFRRAGRLNPHEGSSNT